MLGIDFSFYYSGRDTQFLLYLEPEMGQGQ